MRSIFSFLIILIFSLAMVSCVNRKSSLPVTIEKTKTVTQVVKDTIYKIEADSSFYNAYIECVNGKPMLINNDNTGLFKEKKETKKLLKPKSGKYLSVPKVNLQDGLLTVNCEAEAQELFKQWRETYIQENENRVEIKYVEKPFTWYHKTLMWIGGIFLVLTIIGIVLKFTKS